MTTAWPRYVERLQTIVGDLTQWLGAEQSAKLREAFAKIDLTQRLPGAFAFRSVLRRHASAHPAYVGFLFVESGHMTQKIVAMFPDQTRAQEARNVLNDVSDSVRRYISVKTGVSALTACRATSSCA